MASLYDLHMLAVLRKGWSALSEDKTFFKSLFNGVSDSVLERWFTALFPEDENKSVEFRPSYVPEQTRIPCVIVQYEDTPEDLAPMDYWGGAMSDVIENTTTDGVTKQKVTHVRKHTMLLKCLVSIHIMASNPELLRAMNTCIHAICLINRPAFYSLDYSDVEYLGTSDYQVEQSLMPEDLGLYIRIQRWQSRCHVEISETITSTIGKILIASEDAVVENFSGGVATNNS